MNLIVFTIQSYTTEFDKVEHTFGILKNKFSFQNLSIKQQKDMVIEEIQYLK